LARGDSDTISSEVTGVTPTVVAENYVGGVDVLNEKKVTGRGATGHNEGLGLSGDAKGEKKVDGKRVRKRGSKVPQSERG
jgi:hypothetical protein